MRNTNKKGFTIVELVIVVAVIAILAAVLIPTFSGIIRKANISSDTVVAKNLNTAAISAGAKDFNSAIAAVKEAGYVLANLNAKANGCYFVWDDANDQFLLVDTTDNYKVIYSNTEASAKSANNWLVAVSDPEAIADIEAAGCGVKKIVTSINDLSAALNAGGEFHMDESVVLTSGNSIISSNANSIIELNGSSISTDGNLDITPVHVAAGQLTVNNGNIGGSGNVTNDNGTYTYAVSIDADGKLILNNVNINTLVSGITACYNIDGDAYVEVNNSTIKAGNHAISMSCGSKGGKAVVNNSDCSAENTFFVSQDSVIEIKGGNHTATNSMFWIANGSNSKIVITGGTFTLNGTTYTFEELDTPDEWKALCYDPSYNVTIANGVVTITL